MFSRVRKIEDPHGILAMEVYKGLQPICSIQDRTHLFGLKQMAAAGLHFSQIRKMGGIRQARKIREVSDMDLLRVSRASWNLSNGQGTDFCPFAPGQGNHRSIRTDSHARGVFSLLNFFFPGKFRVACVLFLNVFADFFAEPAGCFWADEDSQQVVENLTGMPKWHPTPQAHQMFLLPRSQGARK
jgi:hypothetical protein